MGLICVVEFLSKTAGIGKGVISGPDSLQGSSLHAPRDEKTLSCVPRSSDRAVPYVSCEWVPVWGLNGCVQTSAPAADSGRL
jgi:hypothetical protein